MKNIFIVKTFETAKRFGLNIHIYIAVQMDILSLKVLATITSLIYCVVSAMSISIQYINTFVKNFLSMLTYNCLRIQN